METNSIVDFERRDGISDGLTDLLRKGAQRLIATAVEAEVESFLAQFTASRTAAGHAGVVRNGHHPARPVQTGIGPVSVRIPKVRSKTGAPVTFRSALVPPYVRKAKSLEAALPWLYLKGVSSGEMGAALQALSSYTNYRFKSAGYLLWRTIRRLLRAAERGRRRCGCAARGNGTAAIHPAARSADHWPKPPWCTPTRPTPRATVVIADKRLSGSLTSRGLPDGQWRPAPLR